jgi:hypothetical protein
MRRSEIPEEGELIAFTRESFVHRITVVPASEMPRG